MVGVASLLGLIPSSFVYVYAGAVSKTLAGGEGNGGGWVATLEQVGLFLVTVMITYVVVRIAMRMLKEALGEDNGGKVATSGEVTPQIEEGLMQKQTVVP